jgi:hypothetical protein
VFQFGVSNDVPVAGDWNGDGIASPGVFRNGEWRLDEDGDGAFTPLDAKVKFGAKGWQPVVGDWNGDGRDDLGIFHEGRWILDTNGNRQIDPDDLRLQRGQKGDQPVAADFNGDGVDEPAAVSHVNKEESIPTATEVPPQDHASGKGSTSSERGAA